MQNLQSKLAFCISRQVPYPAVQKFGMNRIQAVEPEEYFRDGKLQFAALSQLLITKAQPAAADMYDTVPFDIYCSLMKDKLDNGICKECKSYWPSKAVKNRHAKCHKGNSNSEEEQESLMGEMRKMPAVMKIGTKTCQKKMIPKVVRLQEMKECPYLTISLTFCKDHSPTHVDFIF